jgi:hypothetical protein
MTTSANCCPLTVTGCGFLCGAFISGNLRSIGKGGFFGNPRALGIFVSVDACAGAESFRSVPARPVQK